MRQNFSLEMKKYIFFWFIWTEFCQGKQQSPGYD